MVRWDMPFAATPRYSCEAKTPADTPKSACLPRINQGSLDATERATAPFQAPSAMSARATVSAVPEPLNLEILLKPPIDIAVLWFTPSWSSVEHVSLTQLGVNEQGAIYIGGLSNKPQFFGAAAAESTSVVYRTGGWNGDYSVSVFSAHQWFILSGTSDHSAIAGTFALYSWAGSATQADISHRTILSGY